MTGRKAAGSALLDLPAGLGQLASSVRFDVVNVDRSVAFTASQPQAGSGTVAWDGSSSTQRTLQGVTFGPKDAGRIDPIVHRLLPWWVLDDGSAFPLGLFMFSSPQFNVLTGQKFLAASLYDQSVILNQPRESTFSVGPGAPLLPAIMGLIDEVGLTAFVVADQITAANGSAPYLQPPGTSRGQILNDLLLAAGMYPAYFDNSGNLRLKLVPNPLSAAQADVTYSTGPSSRVVRDSIVTANNLAVAPNRYLAIGSSTSQTEVTATFDIPDNAPHSFARRGYRIVQRVDALAASDAAQAQAAAQAAYATDFNSYDEVRFDTPPDPRADGYQIVNFLGTTYREQSWSLPLAPGARMPHTARKVYQP